VSPSSLINNLYNGEEDGFSAPILQNYAHLNTSSAGKSREGLPTKGQPGQASFNMFNWDWESSDKSD